MKTGWNRNTLGCICDIYNGNSINAEYKKKYYTGLTDGYPFIATKDVSFDGKINYDNGVRIPHGIQYKTADKGSVFICAEGGSAGRKIALIQETVCFGNKLFCLKPKKYIQGNFLYFYLRSDTFQSQFKEKLSGLIGGVSAKKLNDIKISYPALSEQQAIVEKINIQFAKIDKLKYNAEKELQEATAAFSIILNKTLTPLDCWEESTLKHLTTSLTDGDHLPPPKSKSGIPFITISNIDKINEVISFENTFYVPKSYYIDLKDSRKATVGDILYTVTGSFGIPILVTENREFCFQRHIALIKPDTDKILSKYLFYWLKSPRLQKIADKAATGAAQRTVSLTSLRQFPVLYPKNKEDQKTIIFQLDSAYDKFFTLKTNFDKITKECEALKQSILREIFD